LVAIFLFVDTAETGEEAIKVDQLKSASQEGIDFEILGKPIGRKQIVWITKGILRNTQLY